ncbi:uncharacterized protein [Dysidea avara]|uniref:uncharacterized protein n=1 Tax=Dysidea avara TaxID=196820 RepID=UPI0033241544
MSSTDVDQLQSEIPNELNESMSVDELVFYLNVNQGIPESFCEILKENYIDGKEFLQLSQQDLKEMIPAIGIVKKLLRLISKDDIPALSSVDTYSPTPCSDQGSTCSTQSVASCTSGSLSASSFEIPSHWRPETDACIKRKELTRESRNDIVRTLVTLTISKVGSKPSRSNCEQVARLLILKYPYMKDDIGDGYTSWVDKMIERIRNLIKLDRKRGASIDQSPAPKRSNNKDKLQRRYPLTQNSPIVDLETFEEHNKAMVEEMKNRTPRDRVLLPLMKTTFQNRWVYVRKDATSVKSIITEYPCLKFPAILEQELAMITGRANVKDSFLREWARYVPAIIALGKKSSKKNVKEVLKTAREEDGDDILALSILVELLAPKNAKETIKFVYTEYQISTKVEDAAKSQTSYAAPRIGGYLGVGPDDQFFVFVENMTLCQCSTLPDAIFLTFSAYYSFYLEYSTQTKSFMWFLQDYIFSYPDNTDRSASYLAVTSDIKRNL